MLLLTVKKGLAVGFSFVYIVRLFVLRVIPSAIKRGGMYYDCDKAHPHGIAPLPLLKSPPQALHVFFTYLDRSPYSYTSILDKGSQSFLNVKALHLPYTQKTST